MSAKIEQKRGSPNWLLLYGRELNVVKRKGQVGNYIWYSKITVGLKNAKNTCYDRTFEENRIEIVYQKFIGIFEIWENNKKREKMKK